MAVIKDVELWHAKLDPKNPVSPFGEPVWEVQMRTTDREVAKGWGVTLKNKNAVKYKDENLRDGEEPYYFVNLKRKAIYGKTGEPAQPVVVVDGELMPIDPTTIGHKSVGNVQLVQKDWEMNGRSGTKSELKAIQITKLVEYKAQGGGLAFDAIGKTEVVSGGAAAAAAEDPSDLWD